MTQVKPIKSNNGEWVLEVLGVPFGGPYDGKDADGEYFDASTDLWLDEIGSRAIVHYHGRDNDGRPKAKPEIIGREIGHEVRPDGVWFTVALDKTKDIARELWEAAKDNFVRASSGAISHLTRINRDSGHIDLWPLAELSLMDINRGEYPTNPYAVAAPMARSLFKAAKLNWPDVLDEPEAETVDQTPPPIYETSEPVSEPASPQLPEEPIMADEKRAEETKQTPALTIDDVANYVEKREAQKAEAQRIADLEAQAAELAELKEQIKAAQEKQPGTEQVKKIEHPTEKGQEQPGRVTAYSKYDGFSLSELGLAYDTLKAAGNIPSAEMYRALHAKALRDIDTGEVYKRQVERDDKGQVRREFSPEATTAAIRAIKAIDPMQLADNPAVKANELLYSTQASGGDEWVWQAYSPELWDQVRNAAMVLPRFRQVEVPAESLTIPAITAGATIYKVGQTTDQSTLDLPNANATMTKVTTSSVVLTPVKAMAWVGVANELIEDSIVPVMASLQQSIVLDIAEQIDEIIISGDTDTSTNNISDTGNGSIATSWHLLIANGLRDYALGNSNSSDRGALTAEDFTAVMALLGTNGAFALNPDRLFWIFDPGVYRKAMLLGETLTAEKAGGVGTFQDGRLQRVFGSDVVTSDKYGKTDANGKIHNTGGNNTKGSFLLVRPDRWVVGFGRQIGIRALAEDVTSAVTDTRHLVASFRFDFKNNGEGSALGFNVTV